MTFTLKPGKDPALTSSYRPISVLDTIGQLFGKRLLTRILSEVSGSGFLRNEQFEFGPKQQCTTANPPQRVSRNLEEKTLTGTVFPDVVQVFLTVWVDGLLHKPTVFNFPLYLVKNICSNLHVRTFKVSFQTTTSTFRCMRVGVDQGGIMYPVLFTLYVNDMFTSSRHVKLTV